MNLTLIKCKCNYSQPHHWLLPRKEHKDTLLLSLLPSLVSINYINFYSIQISRQA